MDVTLAEDILARMAEGAAGDDELLELIRHTLLDDPPLKHLRERWPTDKFPVVDDYYCVARLGQGASGVVFKAISTRGTPRLVALKLLQFVSKEAENRFRDREVAILKSLNVPYVARYLDSGRIGGTMYLVMELVRGRPLDEYLAERTANLREGIKVFQGLCEVVAGLHAKGVIHRDLKPRHVLVDEKGRPWIVDFGLSAVRGEDWSTRVRGAQTELGHIIGTVKYMSPEQAWGGLRHVDHRADIWALGVMLYEIATGGDYPYELDPVGDMTGHDALLYRIQSEAPRKPRVLPTPDAAALETLISRCLVFEPERRIDSAAALARDLSRWLTRRRIHTKRLPWGYRLERIAIGLAVHRRMGLWFSTVTGILVFLFMFALILGVRWQATGEDYGRDSRRSLVETDLAAAARSGEGIVIMGIGDESILTVPETAAALGIGGVTEDIKSWRAVHGRLMERFARARPRAVVWDYIFRTPQPGDGGFVRGVRALWEAGIPVALAVSRYRDDRRPDLSPQLFEPVADIVRHGLIQARDMVLREGEFVIALRRDDYVYPGLALSCFSAMVHPHCRMVIDWQDFTKTIRLIHHPREDAEEFPSVDRVGLTTVYTVRSPSPTAIRPGDVLGCKAFPLKRPHHWAQRTVAYEKVLTASEKELAALVAGKIIIVGDMRAPHPVEKRDRHRVRYATQIVDDVPGCYLLADALSGLMINRYLKSESPLTVPAFAAVAACAFLACLIPPKLSVGTLFRTRRVRMKVIAVLLIASLPWDILLFFARSRSGVYSAMIGAAVCIALAASSAIEFARNRSLTRSIK